MYVCMYVCIFMCMYVCMYIGTFRRTTGFFAVPLRGLLSLAGPTPVLVKFERISVICRCFRGSSTLFSWVLVKVHNSNYWLTQKILKMYVYETGKISIEKLVFFDVIHVTIATSKVSATGTINLLISCVYLLT